MHPNVALRPAGDADEPFLFDLFRAVRAARFDFQPGGHPQMPMMVRLQFQAQEAALASRYPGSLDSLILRDGAPVGRVRVARTETGFQVVDISILPVYQRQGIGTSVIQELMAEARQAGAPISSIVGRTDHPALRFYRKLGFEPSRQDASYVHLRWLPG